MTERFFLLGRINLEHADGSVLQAVLAQPKRIALLAFLVLRGERGATRDLLVETFWPELDPGRGRAALRKGLHFLRRELGADSVVTIGAQVAVSPQALWCDVAAFESALAADDPATAVALYGGELLPGIAVGGAPDWDMWLDGERARLRRLASEAAASAYAKARSAGDGEAAWAHLGAALRIDPGDDAALYRLLLHAAHEGEPERGLRLFDEHRSRLAAEWDIEPSAECLELAANLAAQRAYEPAPPHVAVRGAETASQTVIERPEAATVASALPRVEPAIEERARAWIAAAAVAVLVIAILVPWSVRLASADATDAGPLAVGAVRDMTPSDSAAASAIPELLATNLGRVRGLELIGETRLLELADPTQPWHRAVIVAARRAGAKDVVEGALFHRDGALQLDLRRVDAKSGEVRAAYSVRGADVFELVDAATTALLDDLVDDAPELHIADVERGSLVARRFYQEGLRLYMRGSTQQARPLFAAALDEDSTFAMAAYYLAVANPQFDLAMLDRAARLAEQRPDRERLLIRTMWLQHRDDPRRLAAAESLVARYPSDPEGHSALARARFWGGDFDGALHTLTRLIAMDSAAPQLREGTCRACETYFDLSKLYLHMDSGAAAERVARAYLARNPDSERGWDMLINALEHQGRYAEMEDALKRFAELSGNEDEAHDRRAAAAIRSGNFARADSLLTSRVPLRAESRANQMWYRMISLRYQQRFDEALDLAVAYDSLEAAMGNPDIGLVLRGIVLHESGEHAAAAPLFEEVARRHVGDAPSRARHRAWNLTHAATAYAAMGDTVRLRTLADTVQWLGTLSAYGRDRNLHHHIRGLDATLRGDTAGAISHFRAAMFSPTQGYTRTNLELGRLLNATGRFGEAAEVLESALRGTLSSSQLYVTHTQLHEQLLIARRALNEVDLARHHNEWLRRARRQVSRSARG